MLELTNQRLQHIYKINANVFSFLLAMFILSSVYLLPFYTSMSVGEMLLAFAMLWLAVKYQRVKVFKNEALYLYTIYGVFISIFMLLVYRVDATQTINRLLRDCYYWVLIYIFGYSFFNHIIFKRWTSVICTILSIYILLQFVIYMTTEYLIPGFPMDAVVSTYCSAWEIYQNTIASALRNGYLKANGFLTEGAHCGQALAIGALILFDFDNPGRTDKKNFCLIVLFSIASLLTFSVTGMALIGFVWMFIVMALLRSKVARKKYMLSLLFVLFTFLVIIILISIRLNFLVVITRAMNAISLTTADNSTLVRLYKGFMIWNGMPFVQKVFGIGFGNFENLFYLSNALKYSSLSSEYMNTLSYILVSSGIVGFILYLCYIVKIYIKTNKTGKVMTLLLLLMSFSASPYSSVYWVWMTLVIICGRKNYNERDIAKHCRPN